MKIKEILLLAEEREAEALILNNSEDFFFSERFKLKMDSLIKAQENKRKLRFKRLIAIAIAAALLIASAITAVAFKEKLLDFLEIKTDTHTSLFLPENENANEEIKEIFLPTYIPDGYIVKSYNATSQSVISVWNNGKNDIYFKQLPIKNTIFDINTEDQNYTEAVFGGQPIYYLVKYNTFDAVWHTEDYVYNLNAPWDIGIEEIEKIITSISYHSAY